MPTFFNHIENVMKDYKKKLHQKVGLIAVDIELSASSPIAKMPSKTKATICIGSHTGRDDD